MNIRIIKTDTGYQEALIEIEALMTAEANTPEGEKLDMMVTLVEAYEAQHSSLNAEDRRSTENLAI